MTIDEILHENALRNALKARPYDPVSGLGAFGVRSLAPAHGNIPQAWIPDDMINDPLYQVASDLISWQRLRCRYDFEYWAMTCVNIKDKTSGENIPFRLNSPQRRVLAILEKQRIAGKPIRMILLKARQWGGSTLVQMYMAWIQCVLRRGWNSLICAHVKDTAAYIRSMYSNMLAAYPSHLWEGDEDPRLASFERSINSRMVVGRECRVTVASAESQEALRGGDYAMAHLSEVAFWNDSPRRSPEGFIRSICGSVMRMPYSLIIMESTANGVGNFFHSEWLRATSDEGSDKMPVFVPWYEIDIYADPVDDPEALWWSLNDYERDLWERGLTLEQINWYHNTRLEFPNHATMMAEYPTTPAEAFNNTGGGVFEVDDIEALRKGCRMPAMVGDLVADDTRGLAALRNIAFRHDTDGCFWVWEPPRNDGYIPDRYMVVVDIGGRTPDSDWSVIAVFDTLPEIPVVVAQWRGHIDHDLLAWKSATIAQWYCRALLVIESNTLDSSDEYGVHGAYILGQLYSRYPNMYQRSMSDTPPTAQARIGFHTNRVTKTAAINEMIAAVRDGRYVERSNTACDEMSTFRNSSIGGFGAPSGRHDDVLMTRAIALYILSMSPPRPSPETLADILSLIPRPRRPASAIIGSGASPPPAAKSHIDIVEIKKRIPVETGIL